MTTRVQPDKEAKVAHLPGEIRAVGHRVPVCADGRHAGRERSRRAPRLVVFAAEETARARARSAAQSR